MISEKACASTISIDHIVLDYTSGSEVLKTSRFDKISYIIVRLNSEKPNFSCGDPKSYSLYHIVYIIQSILYRLYHIVYMICNKSHVRYELEYRRTGV